MRTGSREQAVVLYVGRGAAIDPDGRFRLERVGVGSVAERAPYADCAVLEEPNGGLEALERLRGTSVPTVLYDRTADPTVAAEATRRGVTEYVAEGGNRRLSDRIAAVTGLSGNPPEPRRIDAGMDALSEAVGGGSGGGFGSVEALLEAGRKRFGASFGALTEIDGATYSIVAETGGIEHDPTALSRTFCRRPMRLGGPCCLPETAKTCRRESVTGVFADLGSYLGTTVRVDGERYGTVWFGSETPRERFSGDERRFLELLSELLGATLRTGRRTERLRETADRRGRAIRALAAAEEALRNADSADEIAEIAAETATVIVDTEIEEVSLLEDGTRIATAKRSWESGEAAELDDEADGTDTERDGEVTTGRGGEADAATAERPPERGLRRGELLIGDGSGAAEVGPPSASTVTLGDRGVLSVDSGTAPITAAERRRLSLFAARVETAICGLDRPAPGSLDADARSSSVEPESTDDDATDAAGDADADGRGAETDQLRYLFDALPDAAVEVEFVDGEPVVRRINDAFEGTFGVDISAIEGQSLNDVIVPDDCAASAMRLDEDTRHGAHATAEVERLTDDGRMTFLFRGFSYRDGDTERGFGIYTDVTDRLEQERRLRVLHRVLRHNLRNEMTAIIGYANMLNENARAEEAREYSDRIYERAMDVSKLGEQVRRIQQALDLDRRRVALDPEPLVTELADRFRDGHEDATIRVSGGEHGDVVADELLEVAVENLVENSLEHHPDAATVGIEIAAVDDEWVDITIRDDGPGIPERERAVVSGDREITQLDHSVGLGLWLSRWIVSGAGGRLLFGDRSVGSEVTLRLRRADCGEAE